MSASSAITGGEAILRLCQAQEIDYLFCSPLSVWAPLWEALAKAEAGQHGTRPRYVNCRHEVLAVGLASGYYKAAGRMQAVLLPTALGVLNGSMAIRGAYQERVPVLILAPDSLSFGEIPATDPGAEWPAMLGDLGGPVRIAEGYVKWAKEVKTREELASAFRRACYLAETTPRGPVLLSIPFDVLMAQEVHAAQKRIDPAPVVAAEGSLGLVAELIVQARNPIIITDHAGRSPASRKHVAALAEIIGSPVFEFWMPTYVNIDRTHALRGEGMAEEVIGAADCILLLGADAPWYPPLIPLKPGCSVVVVEEDPMRPRASYWGYKTDYCLAGDVGENLAALLRRVKSTLRKHPEAISARDLRTKRWQRYNQEKRRQRQIQRPIAAPAGPVPAEHLFQCLEDLLPGNAVIVDEIIAQLPAMMQVLFRRRSYAHYRGIAGGLGTGIPTALGIRLAEPDKPVVCIIGDGSFSYNPIPACFGLSQQYQLPLLVVICNNEAYASQAWNLQRYFPEGWALKTNNPLGAVIEPTPDYSKIAEAFNGVGEKVTRPDDLKPALQRSFAALRHGRLAVLDIHVQP